MRPLEGIALLCMQLQGIFVCRVLGISRTLECGQPSAAETGRFNLFIHDFQAFNLGRLSV